MASLIRGHPDPMVAHSKTSPRDDFRLFVMLGEHAAESVIRKMATQYKSARERMRRAARMLTRRIPKRLSPLTSRCPAAKISEEELRPAGDRSAKLGSRRTVSPPWQCLPQTRNPFLIKPSSVTASSLGGGLYG